MFKQTITLLLFNSSSIVTWEYGEIILATYNTTSFAKTMEKLGNVKSDYILFWDADNPIPTKEQLSSVIASKGDLWHIGSKLNFAIELPLLDCVQPTTMHHLKVDSSMDHTSWKVSLRGSLMKKSVLDQIPFVKKAASMDIVSLDFGFKAMKSGVITRYSEILAKNTIRKETSAFNLNEELSFIRNNFDKKAFVWCYVLYFFKINPLQFFRLLKIKPVTVSQPYTREVSTVNLSELDTSVSIVIATLERYECLVDELLELRLLQLQPKEIIIVDQTIQEKRSTEFLKDFEDLPISYLESNKIGQCSARNLGIKKATGKFIWFLDDDMKEIPVDYLERHLQNMYSFNADVSCGIPDEIGTNYIDRSIKKIEISDGLPMGDTIVKRELLIEIGGFDVKMDQKQSEDQEIGLRCFKQGALSIKDNQMRILHLRASRGGLRNHNVRKITFASSRNSLTQRRFLHHSEIYLNLKHFDQKKVKKAILLNIRGTFIIRGGMLKKGIKILIAFFMLPHTLYITKKNITLAKKMIE